MRVILLSDLLIPERRQRQLFAEKPLGDLRESILSKGLLHPPVAQFDGETYTLVCGERRTRAIQTIADLDIPFQCDGRTVSPGFIPIILITDLSSIDIREAELEENTHREPLTWQEQAAAIAELYELRGEQAAIAGEAPPTATSVATEIKGDGTQAAGSQIQRVTEAVILSRHLEDPDVLKAKSTKEAMKVVRKKAEAAQRAELAAQFDQSKTNHTLYHASAFDQLPLLPDASVDLILTDPPYGVGADTFGDMSSTGHDYKDDLEYAMQCYALLAHQGFRIAKATATLYAFCDIRHFDKISLELSLAGWNVWDTPLIWSKLNGMLPRPDYGPRRTYEALVMAVKGSPRFLKTGAPDVLTFPLREEIKHGAQKPVELYAELIQRSVLPGATVLDPFSGSGTIFPAANRTKVIAIGMERVLDTYNLALSRMAETDSNPLGDLL